MQIFNYIGYVFGYVLWYFYEFTKNYGVAIILFTILFKIISFPFSVKQQKSMAQTARMQGKLEELRKKCGNDKQRYQQEMADLYSKEGINPMGGCSTMFVPLLVMMGIYYSVIFPLTNTLHVDPAAVNKSTELLSQIPGVGANFAISGNYSQMTVINEFQYLRDYLVNIFNPADISKMDLFSQGFNFLGINLLGTPHGSSFASFLWLIPVLCVVTSLIAQIVTQKITGSANQQQGCMKWSLYFFPLITAYIAYSAPAAVGFYWIISNILNLAQTYIINMFYGRDLVVAKEEAARINRRILEEQNIKAISTVKAKNNNSKKK